MIKTFNVHYAASYFRMCSIPFFATMHKIFIGWLAYNVQCSKPGRHTEVDRFLKACAGVRTVKESIFSSDVIKVVILSQALV